MVDIDGLIALILSETKSDDWKTQYDATNQLRMLNKYHQDILIASLETFTPFIRE